ncbi:Ribosomal lysine N-methyltransferase set10 [Vanrija pseudolonga]|uniref:Ribosomal lysine N-methyltransferase set10 n=1 Tax=Vanrija pseudolonga TaxID=143232 RepID=A0AAF0YBR3_9TREE|nr:Ribosomal lysine N-methyltransferase set10 [Vanrija pseudolonga]
MAPTADFIEWFTHAGGYISPSAELREETHGLGLFATKAIAPDARLISTPFKLAITPALASASIEAVTGVAGASLTWPEGSEHAGEKWNERMLAAAYIGLHWVYADKGGEAPAALAHYPYIRALPPAADLTTPLFFSAEERQLLAGTNLAGAVADREREWGTESAVLRAVLKEDGLTWERYLAVATYLSSRAFPSHLLTLPDGQAQAPSTDAESYPVLLPGLDLLNHTRGQPILWLSSRIAGPGPDGTPIEAISFVAPAAIETGAEIFNNYGAKSNEALLLGYGFVLDANPDDTVVLRLGTGALPPDAKARLDAKGLDAVERFAVGRDGELPKQLLEVVRAMLGEDEHEHDHSDDEDDEHACYEAEEKGLNLELDVLGMLGQMIEDKLAKLKAGGVPGADAKVRPEVARLVKVYRDGQEAILTAALDKLGERVDRIEGLIDESPGCGCGC